jgi:hypothetical protein
MKPTRENHYVPIWYQKGFLLPNQEQLAVLDKNAKEHIILPNGERIQKKTFKPINRRHPSAVFKLFDLYTTTILGRPNDEIEKGLFGRLDDIGANALKFFSSMKDTDGFNLPASLDEFGEPDQAWKTLLEYIDAQKIRTPKAQQFLTHLLATKGIKQINQNDILFMIQQIRQYYITTFGEGLWEIVTAKNSATKFIFSDDPVTIYNCDHFSGAPQCLYPFDPHPYELGSRIIFPLDLDNCLIISNLEFAKNPQRKIAKKFRSNARSYDTAWIDLRDIKKDRHLEEREVCWVNYIVKQRAPRYVAAACEEWLFPENKVKIPVWPKLDIALQHTGFSFKLSRQETVIKHTDGSTQFITPLGKQTIVPGWFNKEHK